MTLIAAALDGEQFHGAAQLLGKEKYRANSYSNPGSGLHCPLLRRGAEKVMRLSLLTCTGGNGVHPQEST